MSAAPAAPPPAPAPPHGSLSAHLSQTAAVLSRTAAFKRGAESRGACAGCGLSRALCICGATRRLPLAGFSLTVLAHASELRKASSTHVPLARATGALVRVWRSAACPTAADAWARVAAAAAAGGGAAAVLFPSPGALPAEQWLRSRGGTGAGARAAVSLLVLDGTWSNVRAMAAELPADAQRIVVSPPGAYTLFGPCRAPPAPGRISTLEAVACFLDELHLARAGGGGRSGGPAAAAAAAAPGADPPGSIRILVRTSERRRADDGDEAAGGGGGGGGGAAPLRTSADAPAAAAFVQMSRRVVEEVSGGGGGGRHRRPDGSGDEEDEAGEDEDGGSGDGDGGAGGEPRSARTVLTAELVVRAPTVEGADFWGSALRRYMQVHVDATLANMNKLRPEQTGVGYRTWFLARAAPPPPQPAAGAVAAGGSGEAIADAEAGGGGGGGGGDDNDGGKPALTLLAGPLFSRIPCYLVTAIATFAYGSDAVLRSGYARAFAADVARWGKVLSPLPPEATIAAAVTASAPHAKRAALGSPAATAAAAAAAAAAADPAAAAAAASAPPAPRQPRVRRPAPLPPCAPHLRTPLAQTCRALYTLAAGHFAGSWPEALARQAAPAAPDDAGT